MSNIAELGENFKNLPKILEQYNNELAEVGKHLGINGKSLENANKENPGYYYYYNQRLVEMNTLTLYFEREVSRVRGKLFKGLTENNNRDLGERAKHSYIDMEPAYTKAHDLYLEVKELRDRYEAAVDGFRQRGYTLNNITKIRVADLEDDLL